MTGQLKGRYNRAKGSVNTYRDNGYARDNTGAVGGGVSYAVRPETILQGPTRHINKRQTHVLIREDVT